MSRLVLSLTVLALAACGSRTTQPATSPDNRPTVEVWKEDLEDNSNSSVLMARNDGTAPVTITEVRLTVCDNLYQDCGVHTPNVRVEPGQTVRVMRLDPSNHARRPRFGWEFRWRALSTPQVRGVVTRSERGSAPMVPVSALAPLVSPDGGGGRCEPPNVVNAPPGYRSLQMRFGPRNGIPTRTIRVQFDPQGTPISYGESRGDMRVAPPGVTPPVPVDRPGARTEIHLDLLRGVAIVENVRPDGTFDRQMATGPDLLHATNLGPPSAMVELMRKECDR